MVITDAQVHLWKPDRPERPWPKPLPVPPQRPDGFSAEDMLKEMDQAGVDRAIIVPPIWAGNSNEEALDIAAQHPRRFAVVGRFDPKAPDAKPRLPRWLEQKHMLGVRMPFHVKPYSDWLRDGSLDWFWAECESHALPVMALVPGMASLLMPVLQRHPNLKLVISHMAAVLDRRAPVAFAGLDALLVLSRYRAVTVMVSSAPCFSSDAYPFRDLTPYIRRVYDAFGPRRMLWGSDLTRLTCSYSDCLDHVRHGLDFLSEDDKGWILGRSLAHVLNWPEAG